MKVKLLKKITERLMNDLLTFTVNESMKATKLFYYNFVWQNEIKYKS